VGRRVRRRAGWDAEVDKIRLTGSIFCMDSAHVFARITPKSTLFTQVLADNLKSGREKGRKGEGKGGGKKELPSKSKK
jgi:hypothetical protein